jgi:hypothetical protein
VILSRDKKKQRVKGFSVIHLEYFDTAGQLIFQRHNFLSAKERFIWLAAFLCKEIGDKVI